MIDEVIAEQLAMDDWQEAEGAQPEDEPLNEAGTAQRFCVGTPQGSVPALTMPERAGGHDIILPGDLSRAANQPSHSSQMEFQTEGYKSREPSSLQSI